MAPRIGVCSWSLRAESPEDLVSKVRAVGVSAVQLALSPLAREERRLGGVVAAFAEASIEIRSGMLSMIGEDYSTLESIRRTGGVRPDGAWDANLSLARAVAKTARRLGLRLVTFHAGFLPKERGSAERRRMIARLRTVADVFARESVRTAFETGQERAEVLLDVLDELERPEVGVNFDPANVVMYGMGDPVEALKALAPRVLQVHVKDAKRTKVSGTWGAEVPVGTGDVDWPACFGVLREHAPYIDLMIEREAGADRVADISRAREFVEKGLGRTRDSGSPARK